MTDEVKARCFIAFVLIMVGALIAAISLERPDSLVWKALLWAAVPGVVFIALKNGYVLLLLFLKYLNVGPEDLLQGDIHNFLPKVRRKYFVAGAILFGVGLFAGGHWSITQRGFGLGVFFLSGILGASLMLLTVILSEIAKSLDELLLE